MPRRRVFTDVMDVVERRIAAGDYMLKDLPGERKLAEEVGVSYMTARKAVSQLIENRVLARKHNGTLMVHPEHSGTRQQIDLAMLSPAYPSAHFLHCRLAIARAADQRNARFRPVEYVHWHDPAIHEALDKSDGVILIPSTEPVPTQLLREFTAPGRRVVFFDDDMSDHGLPSIRLYSRDHISQLFDYLWALGHRRIDCLNAQGHNREIERRIAHWQSWLDGRGGTGRLWDTPAPPYNDPIALAYMSMRRVLKEEADLPTALVCTTQPAAQGVIRACHEAGVQVGKDLSVCTINNEPTGRFFTPSLTGLDMPDVAALIEPCFEWFGSENGLWSPTERIAPEHANLFLGESTGPPPGR